MNRRNFISLIAGLFIAPKIASAKPLPEKRFVVYTDDREGAYVIRRGQRTGKMAQGYIYCPFIPLYVTDRVDSSQFISRRGMRKLYGKRIGPGPITRFFNRFRKSRMELY